MPSQKSVLGILARTVPLTEEERVSILDEWGRRMESAFATVSPPSTIGAIKISSGSLEVPHEIKEDFPGIFDGLPLTARGVFGRIVGHPIEREELTRVYWGYVHSVGWVAGNIQYACGANGRERATTASFRAKSPAQLLAPPIGADIQVIGQVLAEVAKNWQHRHEALSRQMAHLRAEFDGDRALLWFCFGAE